MITLVKNGNICDGENTPSYKADIVICDDIIEKIGDYKNFNADFVIDANNKDVTPGFIDPHRHLDFDVLNNNNFGKIELSDGITTAIGGNCGLAPYPSADFSRDDVWNFIEPCLGKACKGIKLQTVSDFLFAVQKSEPHINIGTLVATGAVKSAVKGFEKTPYTNSEMDKAIALVLESLEAGACGISSGIMYTPECYGSIDEYVRLLKPAAKFGRVLTTHIRGEGDGLADSVNEVISIAKQSGLPLNISHLKSVGKRNWQREIFKVLSIIEAERGKGMTITADFYPYTGGSTTLMTLIPPSFLQIKTEDTLNKLKTSAGVDALREEVNKPHKGWDNMVLDIGFERIVISAVNLKENKKYQGKNIAAICEEYGYNDEIDFVAKLLISENGKVSIIVMSMLQNDVDTIAKTPWVSVISDSLYGAPDCPHPRLYGSFSKIIRDYVVERKILSFETAIAKMTSMTARKFGLKKRGAIREGFIADLNIFSRNSIRDMATFENPKQLSSGMEWIVLGGEIAYSQKITEEKHGKIIKCQ